MFGHYATHCPQRNKNPYEAAGGGDGANGGLEDDQMMPESNNSLM